MSPSLDAGAIEAAARDRLGLSNPAAPGWEGRVTVLGSTGSTNDDAWRMALAGAPAGSAVFAEEQLAGRGRKSNRWSAPAGRNLTFSVVLRPDLSPQHWPRMAHGVALAVARAIDPWLAPLRAAVKWPNDVFAGGRKLAGILVETSLSRVNPFLVAGVGLNVNSTPEDFAQDGLDQPVASILSLNGGRIVDRNPLAGEILAELWRQSVRCGPDFASVIEELRGRSWLLGREVDVWQGNASFRGLAVDLGANGELLVQVRQADGREAVREVVNADLVRPVP